MSFTEIRVGDIERELASRWREVEAETVTARTRSCSLNLIVCIDDVRARDDVSVAVGRLADTHPIRAITIVEDQNADQDVVQSWLGVGCAPVDSGAVCSEEIVLSAHPTAAGRLASVAKGLLSADMPVFLWWRGGPPAGNQLFAQLAPDADKLIVD